MTQAMPAPTPPIVPHNPLDIVPVPAHSIFCKACCTVHASRAQLCPAGRLDICTIHKTVYVPHEKSLLHAHLQDVDTECPDCTFGSEKKVNKALKRENSRALRPAINHKDMVFCVYCWAPATKKCTHLASCREHSMLYLRSQVDINSKWWLRPSDFACLSCPLTGVMPKKAGEWKKELMQGTGDNLFGSDWDDWRAFVPEQIYRLRPGAFQTWDTRCEWVAWMDNLGKNEMLFLRFSAYQGIYPITCIYAETGTIPRIAANVPAFGVIPTATTALPTQTSVTQPPPPYASPINIDRIVPVSSALIPGSDPPAPVFQTAMSPRQTFQEPTAMMPRHQLPLLATLNGNTARLDTTQLPVAPFRPTPRRSQSQTMYHRDSRGRTSEAHASQIRTTYYTEPSQYLEGAYAGQALPRNPQTGRIHYTMPSRRSQGEQSLHSIHEVRDPGVCVPRVTTDASPMNRPHHHVYPSQISASGNALYAMGHPALSTESELGTNLRRIPLANGAQRQPQLSFSIPVTHQYTRQQPIPPTEPQIQPNIRRVSFVAQENHQINSSQSGLPQDIYNVYPSYSRPVSVDSDNNPAMAEFMESLRSARRPPPPSRQSLRSNRSLPLPGAFPPDDDSDWETTSDDEGQRPRQSNPQPEIPLPAGAYAQGQTAQSVIHQNPIYATFQRSYAQAALGNGLGQYGVGNTPTVR